MKIFRTDPDRFGIRARMLTLLIPGILGLLAMDSWNDYRAMRSLVQDAYDRSMLESVNALRRRRPGPGRHAASGGAALCAADAARRARPPGIAICMWA